MKSNFYKYFLHVKEYMPYVMLVLLLSGIAITSFHHHDCSEESDSCVVCRLHSSFYSTNIEAAVHKITYQNPLPESLINRNDSVTDPSKKLICYTHAPPHYS